MGTTQLMLLYSLTYPALPEMPQESTSAVVSAFLFLITLSAIQIWAPLLASTPQLTIAGGFCSSLLFFFGLIVTTFMEEFDCISVHRQFGA